MGPGAVNTGKSTLINAVIKIPDLLPHSDNVCTSRITTLRKSTDSKFRVYINSETKPLAEFEKNELTKLQEFLPTVVGNKNSTQVGLLVDIEIVGCELLDLGLEIVDTPGYNENAEIREKSLDFMQSAAVVVFVINRDDGTLNAETTAALQELRAKAMCPLFILNKVDEEPDPKKYRTAAKIKTYHEEKNIAVQNFKLALTNLFSEIDSAELYYPLSALEALNAIEDASDLPIAFLNFQSGLAGAIHMSLNSLGEKSTLSFLQQCLLQDISNQSGLIKG